MTSDEGDRGDGSDFSDGSASDSTSGGSETSGPTSGADVRVGEYTWKDFMIEYGHQGEIDTLYPDKGRSVSNRLGLNADGAVQTPTGDDWEKVDFDPQEYLGYHPDDISELISETLAPNANLLWEQFIDFLELETTPVVKDVYTLEHYKREHYYTDNWNAPRSRLGKIKPYDWEKVLGFEPDEIEDQLQAAGNVAMELDEYVDERTVNVSEDIDEDDFFSTDQGNTTVTNRYDLEKAVPPAKKKHFNEVERYWVNKPYSFTIIFHSEKENEKKYYVIEPYCNEIEAELQEFLSGKLRTAIKYADDGVKSPGEEDGRREVIERETRRLLRRYDLFEGTTTETTMGVVESIKTYFDDSEDEDPIDIPDVAQLDGLSVRPEPLILEEDPDTVTEYQVEKLLYLLKRDFIGYERIDPIKHDINVEDISCDGYNSPVFVYHSEYEQIITNVHHGEDDLDDFVVKLAQRSGKGISKRLPQVDATLPDGSRAQLTLGKEVSDHGTNYTIRQFKDVPFTPIDLINWNTFSLDEMAFLWLCIENHKSLIFAGGTASGKTTSLNAVSLFIPANTKIVSIEDTREVELPQRNWIASMTRPSFAEDSTGDIDEFDLLEAALRQRPDYIVMGEIRGEEGRTLFQVMSTGHTTYTTFHADSVDEVLKRFTTDPINVSKTMFTALDLVSIQTQTRVQGRKVRRNKSLTEINHYEAENDEINVQDVYQWQAETDEYIKMGDSNTLDEIMFDRGWSHEKLQGELFKRKVILAYLIRNGLNTYAEVAATVQAFINDPETILTLIANGQLKKSLEDLREMESVHIDVDPSKEELVPRPDASSETYNLSMDVLERAEESIFDEYRGKVPSGLASALDGSTAEDTAAGELDGDDQFQFDDDFDDGPAVADWDDSTSPDGVAFDDSGDGVPAEGATNAEAPSWLDDGETIQPGQGTTDEPIASTQQPQASGESTDSDGVAGQTASSTASVDEATDGLELDDPSSSVAESTDSDGAVAGEQSTNDLDALFTDMDETLAAMEANRKSKATSSSMADSTNTTDDGPDTSDFDDMFPGDDVESIFADGSSAGTDDDRDWGLGARSDHDTEWTSSDTGDDSDSVFGHDGSSLGSGDDDDSIFGSSDSLDAEDEK